MGMGILDADQLANGLLRLRGSATAGRVHSLLLQLDLVRQARFRRKELAFTTHRLDEGFKEDWNAVRAYLGREENMSPYETSLAPGPSQQEEQHKLSVHKPHAIARSPSRGGPAATGTTG